MKLYCPNFRVIPPHTRNHIDATLSALLWKMTISRCITGLMESHIAISSLITLFYKFGINHIHRIGKTIMGFF
jgi:hypothetical protein